MAPSFLKKKIEMSTAGQARIKSEGSTQRSTALGSSHARRTVCTAQGLSPASSASRTIRSTPRTSVRLALLGVLNARTALESAWSAGKASISLKEEITAKLIGVRKSLLFGRRWITPASRAQRTVRSARIALGNVWSARPKNFCLTLLT